MVLLAKSGEIRLDPIKGPVALGARKKQIPSLLLGSFKRINEDRRLPNKGRIRLPRGLFYFM